MGPKALVWTLEHGDPMRRRPWRRFYRPEQLGPDQDERDAAVPGRRYYVYVLTTEYGHYVGHSARVSARVRQHKNGDVPSTADGNPMLVWNSYPLSARYDAARFEAALKALRDQRSDRFREITGQDPIPFLELSHEAFWPGRLIPFAVPALVAAVILLGLGLCGSLSSG